MSTRSLPLLLGLLALAPPASFVACDAALAPDGSVGVLTAPLTQGQVNALNNVGRTTGITYAMIPPPEPGVGEVLALLFEPVDLVRFSEYTTVAGAFHVAVLASPPDPGVAPPDPGIAPPDPGQDMVIQVDLPPPDPGMEGAPPLATFRMISPPDPGVPPSVACDVLAGGLEARLVASPPPEPGRDARLAEVRLGTPPPDPGTPPPEPGQPPPDPGHTASFAIYGDNLSILGTTTFVDGAWRLDFQVLGADRAAPPVFDSGAFRTP